MQNETDLRSVTIKDDDSDSDSDASAGKVVEAPLIRLVDPITQQVMRDPVKAGDGKVYERRSLENWIEKMSRRGEKFKSPMTKELCPELDKYDADVETRKVLAAVVEEFHKQQGAPKKGGASMRMGPSGQLPTVSKEVKRIHELGRQFESISQIAAGMTNMLGRVTQDLRVPVTASASKRCPLVPSFPGPSRDLSAAFGLDCGRCLWSSAASQAASQRSLSA